MKKFEKIEAGQDVQYENFTFEKAGDSLEGIVKGVESRKSKYGTFQVAQILSNKKRYSVVITAGLKIYDIDDFIGNIVRITYEGEKTNEKTGRVYKSFDFSVLRDEDLPF